MTNIAYNLDIDLNMKKGFNIHQTSAKRLFEFLWNFYIILSHSKLNNVNRIAPDSPLTIEPNTISWPPLDYLVLLPKYWYKYDEYLQVPARNINRNS